MEKHHAEALLKLMAELYMILSRPEPAPEPGPGPELVMNGKVKEPAVP